MSGTCHRWAIFQALSWDPDFGTHSVVDPCETRSGKVRQQGVWLKCHGIETLQLGRYSDGLERARVWWPLRELILIDIKDERIAMEMLTILCILAIIISGVVSVVVLIYLQQITALTIVQAVLTVIMIWFVYCALTAARDINLMCKEHVLILRCLVLQMRLNDSTSLSKSEKQEHAELQQFLLEMAGLIERQPMPETVASTTVTPELFSTLLGTLATALVTSLWNVISGLIKLEA